jgi:sulfoxide reductase heme-binding subunit YedZ
LPFAFVGCCIPLLVIGVQLATVGLGADPVETLLNDFGYVAFTLLVLTLACTPAQMLLGWKWPIRIRKLLGDFCFFYACLHLSTYIGLDQGLDLHEIEKDVLKHKFVFLGMGTWLLLLPLAVTSTRGWQKRLGFRRWKRLHRLVYLAGGLATFHFLLRFKTPRLETLAWMTAVALLLALRLDRARVVESKT